MISAAPLVLASGSPRRRQLLQAAGISLARIAPPDIPELPQASEAPVAFARRISRDKATAVPAPGAWVLAADTVVHLDGELFGKPTDDAHAAQMLTRLAGRWHQVTTAWCLRWAGPGPAPARPARRTGHRTSRVCFRPLSPTDIHRYVAGGEGRDKAGAYAIQGQGMVLVERVRGSYTNVVGLPVGPVLADLARVGLAAPSPPSETP